MTLRQKQVIGMASFFILIAVLALMMLSAPGSISGSVQGSLDANNSNPYQSNHNGISQTKIPDLAEYLLSNQWGSDSESPAEEILKATGHQDYIGSYEFPGTINITNAPHGAHTITLTVKAVPGGILWDKGTHVFVFSLSQDQSEIRRINNNAMNIENL